MMKPTLAVWKFSSCDGCQLTLLDCEDELLAVAAAIDIVHFPEASSNLRPDGPFDLTLVEGSISTAERSRLNQSTPAALTRWRTGPKRPADAAAARSRKAASVTSPR